jgi:hypothetical protein
MPEGAASAGALDVCVLEGGAASLGELAGGGLACVVDVRCLAAGAEALGAGAGASVCVVVCTVGEAGMCASLDAAELVAEAAEACRRAYFVDLCLAELARDRLLVELARDVLAADGAAPDELDLGELADPEPPQPAAVSAMRASSARTLREWRGRGIDMLYSGSFSALVAGWSGIFHT